MYSSDLSCNGHAYPTNSNQPSIHRHRSISPPPVNHESAMGNTDYKSHIGSPILSYHFPHAQGLHSNIHSLSSHGSSGDSRITRFFEFDAESLVVGSQSEDSFVQSSRAVANFGMAGPSDRRTTGFGTQSNNTLRADHIPKTRHSRRRHSDGQTMLHRRAGKSSDIGLESSTTYQGQDHELRVRPSLLLHPYVSTFFAMASC